MASSELEYPLGFVDNRQTQASLVTVYNDNNYASVGQLRTALSTRDPAYYTTLRLNEMTKNDMVYAVRTLDDAGGIN